MSLVGVDAGGTRTRAVHVEADGRVLGYAESGPGNPVSAGRERAAAAIVDACSRAVGEADPPEVVAIALAGASGVGGELPEVEHALSARGWSTRVVIRHDLLGAYFSATTASEGAVLVAGTGAVAGRVQGGELATLVDGCGWLVGDEGSGFWIGRRVVREVLAAIDGRGPATALTDLLMAEVEVSEADRALAGDPRRVALIRAVHAGRPVELARFAPLAFAAGDDAVAGAILRNAGEALAATVGAAVAGLDADAPVAVGGGVLSVESPVSRRVLDALGTRARPVEDGVVGAAIIALRASGGAPNEAVRLALAEQLHEPATTV